MQQGLLALLQDGSFHSGQTLAQQLAMSRTAVWKQIQKLQDKGLRIEKVRGKGYRLLDCHKPLQAPFLALPELSESQIHVFDSIDSTNQFLMQRANQFSVPTVCVAEQQTAGKGRRGRQWISPYASHIYCSVLWPFNLGLTELSGVSICVGIAIVEALQKLGVTDLTLKWPNDIRHQGRKLAGILLEAKGEAEGPSKVVIGFGINVYTHPDNHHIDQPWICLEQLMGQGIDRNKILQQVLQSLFSWLSAYPTQTAKMVQCWNQYDEFFQQPVRLIQGERCIEGIAQGINEQGALLLQHDGIVSAMIAGEMSLRAAK